MGELTADERSELGELTDRLAEKAATGTLQSEPTRSGGGDLDDIMRVLELVGRLLGLLGAVASAPTPTPADTADEEEDPTDEAF